MLHFTSDVYLYAFTGANTLLLLQTVLYCIKILGDLEQYYVNVEEGCDILNKLFLFKAFFHLFVSFVLFGNHHDYLFLFNLPVLMLTWKDVDVLFDAYQAVEREEIRKQLNMCKLYAVFFLVSFGLYMYLLAVKIYSPTVVTVRLTASS